MIIVASKQERSRDSRMDSKIISSCYERRVEDSWETEEKRHFG